MDMGMLWYDDDDRRRFDEKVTRAVEYYRAKYGVQPTECFVNPSMLSADARGAAPAMTAGVRLHTTRTVLSNHFWLGVGENGAGGGNGASHRRRFTGGNS